VDRLDGNRLAHGPPPARRIGDAARKSTSCPIGDVRTFSPFRPPAAGGRDRRTIADGADEELGSDGSDAPRTLSSGRLVAGVFSLEREWKSFRVPLSDYPELDLRNVRTLRFVIGGDLNEKSARVYLDDIGLE
jgi:hypothetical protein